MGTTCVCNNLLLVLTVPIKLDIYVFLSFECVNTRRRLLQTHVVPIKLDIYVFLSFECVSARWRLLQTRVEIGKRRYLPWWVRRVSVITFSWYSHNQKTGKRRYLTWWVRRVSFINFFWVFWVCEYQKKVITDTRRTHQVRYLRFPVFWVCEYQKKVITDTRRTHQVRYLTHTLKRQENVDI
jgi:hypothetical protein